MSIGFFWEPEEQKGEFKGKPYDFVMRKIFIDHVAVGNWKGRCAYPVCGIGINGKLAGLNPYPNEHSCRLKDPNTLDIVGSDERKHDGKTYRVIFGKPKGKPKDRCQNALARWGKFCEEYTQPERNIVYERIVRRALRYGIEVKYQSDLAEAKALPESVKKQLEGYESADSLIAKANALVEQLKGVG